jgi:heme/copper-type cytochrome/quinol oxidase subunit 2
MTNKLTTISLMAIGLLTISVPVFAHHGTAAFNTEKTITMKATVTQWYWANPHCFLRFDYQNDKGEVEHWVVETSNPPDMTNKGWSRNTLKVGDEITVTLWPVKNGKPLGRVSEILLPNGQTLRN